MGARTELHGEDPEAPHTPAEALQPRRRARRGLPAPLSEVAGKQEMVERHFVEHLAEFAPMVQILDAPVPQMVDNVLDALRIPVRPMAVQVIEVPKILIDVIPARSLVPEPQTAEQLVEVPTVLSPSRIALRIAEQIVDTPVPQGRGGKRRVQGLLPELGSTAASSSLERISERTVEQTVFPSRDERILERIVEQTDFPSREERISERTVEQIVDIPVHGRVVSSRGGFHGSVPAVPGQSSTAFGGGHQDFLPEQVSTAFSGAEHVYGSPVPGERPDYGRLHGSVAGQSSTTRRGAHLHELLPEDVVDEELQERLVMGLNKCGFTPFVSTPYDILSIFGPPSPFCP